MINLNSKAMKAEQVLILLSSYLLVCTILPTFGNVFRKSLVYFYAMTTLVDR